MSARLSLRNVVVYLPIVFSSMVTSALGDDTPKTMCLSIRSLWTAVRPWDLSELSQNQQSNVGHYLSELDRKGAEPPRRLLVMRDDIVRDESPHFLLIFESGGCDELCKGTAILPDAIGFKTLEFSYRKNLVMRPRQSPRGGIASFILLDAKGQPFLSFQDLYEKADPTQADGRSVRFSRSEYAHVNGEKFGDDLKNYVACLQNVFDVNSAMPGSGAN